MSIADTTVTLPPITTVAAAVVVVLTAAGLIGRFIVRPLVNAARFMKETLDTFGAVVEQVADLVTYTALFVIDTEARLNRIEDALDLGPYKRREVTSPSPTLKEEIARRVAETQAIRDAGADR